jgi:hypothetical protein
MPKRFRFGPIDVDGIGRTQELRTVIAGRSKKLPKAAKVRSLHPLDTKFSKSSRVIIPSRPPHIFSLATFVDFRLLEDAGEAEERVLSPLLRRVWSGI